MWKAIVAFLLPLAVSAQTNFAVLYDFTNQVPTSGDAPYGGLVCSSNVLYGTTADGGSNGMGVIFKINCDGTGYTNLYTFTAFSLEQGTNADGAEPYGALILSGNTLYGTAEAGALHGYGSIFRINTDGTGFTNLHSFSAVTGPARTNYDGAHPHAGLFLTNGILYGTAADGGTNDDGTVFELSTNGENFAVLKTFLGAPDGESPQGGLTFLNGVMFGTTVQGGVNGTGTIFRMNPDGSHYANIYSFSAENYDPNSGYYTNFDGDAPRGTLLAINGTLIGNATIGGSNDFGTIFNVSTNGKSFVLLHAFSGTDGKEPYAGLVNSGSTLYGTTTAGGAAATNGNNGATVFQINADGSGFTTVHNFSDRADGSTLFSGLVLSGNELYGDAYSGGAVENGTIYAISLPNTGSSPVPLEISYVGTNIVLIWTNAAFGLQATGALTTPFTNVPAASSPYTILSSGGQGFYRLMGP